MLQAEVVGFGRSLGDASSCGTQSYPGVSAAVIPVLLQMLQQYGMAVSGSGNSYTINPNQHSVIVQANYDSNAQVITLALSGGDFAVSVAPCSAVWSSLNSNFAPLLQQAQAAIANTATPVATPVDSSVPMPDPTATPAPSTIATTAAPVVNAIPSTALYGLAAVGVVAVGAMAYLYKKRHRTV